MTIYQTRNPKSIFIVISVGEKTIKKCYANQRRHDDYIGDAFGMQHVILQGVNCVLHNCDLM